MQTCETLCVICKAEQEQSFHHQNATSDGNRHPILPIGDAIIHNLHDMQSKLAGMAKFIETKRSIDFNFPDEMSLHNFKVQNQYFDDAYSEAHRLFTEF